MRRVQRAVAAAAVALALAASGCSGTPTDPSSNETPNGRPLDAYLEPPGDDKASADKQKKIEELVAACMKEQGFTYLPRSDEESPPEEPDFKPENRDWVEKYGYGVTTLDDELVVEVNDPNEEALKKMTEKQREAYMEALHGNGGGGMMVGPGGGAVQQAKPADGGKGGEGGAPEDLGCYGKADAEVYPDQKPVDFDEFQDLFDAISKLEGQLTKDSRIAPLIEEWAGCMAGKGHTGLKAITDAEDSIHEKWAELNGGTFERSEDGGSQTTVRVEAGDDNDDKPDPKAVAELRTEEVELALADFDCKAPHVATYEKVRTELEEQFIEDHRAELERYRDQINAGR